MSTSLPAVVFDLEVLLDFDYGLVVERVGARSRHADRSRLHRLLVESALLPAYERGELTSRQFFEVIRTETGFLGEFEEFAGYFSDIFSEIAPMVRLQDELRSRGVATYIFSNTNDLAIDHIRRNYAFFAHFDDYVLSYQHGSMKPDAPIYAVVERVTGRRGEELLYFDDRPENVEAGAARGWRAFVHHDPVESRRRLEAIGLLG